MGFSFGNIKTTEKPKQNLEKFDAILKDHRIDNEKHILFLVNEIISKEYLSLLVKDIEKAGIQSYYIASIIKTKTPKDESTEYLRSIESNWRQFLCANTEAVIAFGSAIRVLNQSADANYYDFIEDKFNSPRYYCGSEFVDGTDTWVYPVATIKDIYPISHGNEYTNFLTRIFRDRLKRVQKDDLSLASLDMNPYDIIVAENKEQANQYLLKLCDADLLSIDIETDGLNFMTNNIGTVQLSIDGQISYFIDWEFIDKRVLNKVISTAKRITGSNIKFDWRFFRRFGIAKNINYTDDTSLLSHAINSSRSKGLKPGAIFYVGKFVGYDLELDRALKEFECDNFMELPRHILVKYAGLDPIVAWRLQRALDTHVQKLDKLYPNEKKREWTIERWYREVMIPNANAVTDVEMEGIYFDPALFNDSEEKIRVKIKELKEILSKEWDVSVDFKFESTKELGLLFQKMGWPLISESKAGGYATSDAVLNEYELMGKPGIKTLKDLRSYNVALKTFIDGWRKWLIQHEDGTWRIHPSCNTFGTESHRHAMRDPNFQQIPSRGKMAPLIKRLFVAPPNEEDDWYKIEQNEIIYEGWNDDIINTQRGKIRFDQLLENDEILVDYKSKVTN